MIGIPPKKKDWACIINILLNDSAIKSLFRNSKPFSNPHNEASEPEILASFVFGFTANNAPMAGLISCSPL